MPGHRQQLLLRRRHLRNWAALLAVFALVAWVIEIASHLHVNHDVQLSAQGSHFCEMCAGFQAGASASAVAPTVPKTQPPLLRAVASVCFPPLRLTYSYRSRAPPHA